MDKKIKILVFRTDRIGDLINTSSFLKSIKKYYTNSEIDIVCSKYNSVVAKNYDFINNVFIYNKKRSILSKIIFFFKIIFNYYDDCIVIDGKTISKLISFFIRAKKKYIVSFKTGRSIFGIKFNLHRPPLFFCRLFYSTYIVCDEDYNNKEANAEFNNHYLSMYYYLLKKDNVRLIPDKHTYSIGKDSQFIFNKFFHNNIYEKFLCIHIDYKWDEYNLDINKFNSILRNTSVKKNIVITSGIEGSSFFNKLKNYYTLYTFINNNYSCNKLNSTNIMLIENLSVDLLACFLKESLFSISSHSGATVHISAAFNIPIIDFIKKSKANEYDRWIPPNIIYSRAFVDKLENLESAISDKIEI